MALALTRREGESVLINDDILVTLVWSRAGSVKLTFEAPPEVSIVRTELLEKDTVED